MRDIGVGFHAFTSNRNEEFGAIRGITPDGKMVRVYVENSGEFEVPAAAVVSVAHHKVTFDPERLDEALREAIAHAHDAEIANDDEIRS